MACQDMSGTAAPADFDWFEYVERPYRIEPVGTARRVSLPLSGTTAARTPGSSGAR